MKNRELTIYYSCDHSYGNYPVSSTATTMKGFRSLAKECVTEHSYGDSYGMKVVICDGDKELAIFDRGNLVMGFTTSY